ncbi:transporter, CPA2 family [Leptotrichia sp. oral taxon 215 str. W9775]|uniref:cation:proton antiporter n=1 Tax=Leptotrichia sp. oral taxon 215 TaxID=712359 RepID=UPI0003ADA01A|nr:cation:proton antiporter [Leptotrichia sp. oral taxon 215]ERK65779.1 transporter, CPA2 family [Leptotrichia sp. oral taxon 215 str. W9775]
MLFSLTLIFLSGIVLGSIFNRLKLPQLLGMLLTGIILGPYLLNLLDPKILSISTDLRQIALIIILTRAGLNLDINDLKKVGRPAVLMCFVPATFEILGMIIFAPKFLGLGLLDSAILGTVIAAVSPAVVVPKMLKLMEDGYGTEEGIPQLIMAGASVDDVFVIVLFTSFIGLASNGTFSALNLIKIPTSIFFGISVGFLCAILLIYFFKKVHIRDSMKVIIILNISFLLVTFEHSLTGIIGFSGLLAIMSMGTGIQEKNSILAKRLSSKYSKLWIAAEVMLFVLVGATVNIKYALGASIPAILLIMTVIVFRMVGVFLCLLGTSLSYKERLFCMIAYCPKATVQAAIGSIPLSMGLSSGNIILTVAVLSILITAPLGAFAIDFSYKKLLNRKL